MRSIKKGFIFIFSLWLIGCGSDDSPSVSELITAQPWRVNSYDVQASTLGVAISQDLLEPFLADILAQAPINGTITFNADNTFTLNDQSTIVNGTWSLSGDGTEITIVFPATSETFTFEIVLVTPTNLDLKYTVTQEISIQGNPVPVTLEITAFMIPG